MPHRRLAASKESQQTGELADAITNASAIKTFAAESFEEARYAKTNKDRAKLISKSWEIAAKNNIIVQLLCAFLLLALFAFGVHDIEIHVISISTYLLFQVYVLVIINNINGTITTARQIEGILGDSHEMTLLFERIPHIKDVVRPEKLQLVSGDIRFSSVDFSYAPDTNNNQLFHNFDLTIKPGERVGLVGPSGGGKTTITKLLLRFIDIQGGAITIDGQDIRNITQEDLHKAIAYVPQEPLLFHRSLYENISYGNPEADKGEVMRASKQAHADDFISVLPDGYKTTVGERGIKLSGGQRQRVAIARAMLKTASVLVLDEATSALDSESEKYIQKGLWELMRGKTSLIIAHRLSTIRHMDRIIVLDKGRIIEEGTHEQLLKANGLYAKLWTHQSGGFLKV
jgi:ATP-binding cassette subfamily B protein